MIPSSFQPLAEQERARELFLRREGLKIDAYAGTGKTTTLHLLAASTRERGLYLAFNRSIADEARLRFPAQVTCATTHSIAFRGVRRSLGYPEWKLTGSLTAHVLRTGCNMPESIPFGAGLLLSDRTYSALLLDALRRFLQSDEDEPEAGHVPHHGLWDTTAI